MAYNGAYMMGPFAGHNYHRVKQLCAVRCPVRENRNMYDVLGHSDGHRTQLQIVPWTVPRTV